MKLLNSVFYQLMLGFLVVLLMASQLRAETANLPPSVNVGSDKEVVSGQSITIKGTASDSDGKIVSYKWTRGRKVMSTAQSFIYSPKVVGQDTLVLTVADDKGAIARDDLFVTVVASSNIPPKVSVGSDKEVVSGQSITIKGIASDSDGKIVSYKWTRGRKVMATAQNFVYSPKVVGKDTLVLTVTDDKKAIARDALFVTVLASSNIPPKVNVGSDKEVVSGQSITIKGTASDNDGEVVSYKWTRGSKVMATAQNFVYSPKVVGKDTLVLTVTDNKGAIARDALFVTVLTSSNIPPKVDVGLGSPKNLRSVVGDGQITLSWDKVSGAVTYDVCYSKKAIVDAKNCTTTGEVYLATKASPLSIANLQNGVEYFFVVFAKNTVNIGSSSEVHRATPVKYAATKGGLNDTGVVKCGNYAYDGAGNHSNSLHCSAKVDSEGNSIPRGQDGNVGRDADVRMNSNKDGHGGFSFAKLDANGSVLTVQNKSYTSQAWSCVEDLVTGLVWEVKSNAGLHKKQDDFYWYNTNSKTNGGSDGLEGLSDDDCYGYIDKQHSTYCNTEAYIARVNKESFCGASNWRLPTRGELQSLVSYDRFNSAIDKNYFPNALPGYYWSSSVFANENFSSAWVLYSYHGHIAINHKFENSYVRLVMGRR